MAAWQAAPTDTQSSPGVCPLVRVRVGNVGKPSAAVWTSPGKGKVAAPRPGGAHVSPAAGRSLWAICGAAGRAGLGTCATAVRRWGAPPRRGAPQVACVHAASDSRNRGAQARARGAAVVRCSSACAAQRLHHAACAPCLPWHALPLGVHVDTSRHADRPLPRPTRPHPAAPGRTDARRAVVRNNRDIVFHTILALTAPHPPGCALAIGLPLPFPLPHLCPTPRCSVTHTELYTQLGSLGLGRWARAVRLERRRARATIATAARSRSRARSL